MFLFLLSGWTLGTTVDNATLDVFENPPPEGCQCHLLCWCPPHTVFILPLGFPSSCTRKAVHIPKSINVQNKNPPQTTQFACAMHKKSGELGTVDLPWPPLFFVRFWHCSNESQHSICKQDPLGTKSRTNPTDTQS